MKDLVWGWEPEDEVPPWLSEVLVFEPLVKEYGFPWEYWHSQEARIVEALLELLKRRNERREMERLKQK